MEMGVLGKSLWVHLAWNVAYAEKCDKTLRLSWKSKVKSNSVW